MPIDSSNSHSGPNASDTAEMEGQELFECPECGTQNPREAAICTGCRQPIDYEATEEKRSRRRHPSTTSRRRANKTEDPLIEGDEAFVWQARLPLAERVKREVPEWSYNWVTRERLRWIAVGAGVLVVLVVFLAWPDSARTERSGQLDLTFRYPGGWVEISPASDLPNSFTVASRLTGEGGEIGLAITRDGASLAMITLPKDDETETTEPQVLAERAEALRLIYQISTDARVGQPHEVSILGARGISVQGERVAAGQRIREETVVLFLEDQEVYILMSAPESQWESDRQAMEQILKSARRT